MLDSHWACIEDVKVIRKSHGPQLRGFRVPMHIAILTSSFCSILFQLLFIVVWKVVLKSAKGVNKVLKHAQTNSIKFKSYQNSLSLWPLLTLWMPSYLIAHRYLRLWPQGLFLDSWSIQKRRWEPMKCAQDLHHWLSTAPSSCEPWFCAMCRYRPKGGWQ